MSRFRPSGSGVEWGSNDSVRQFAVARHPNGRFVVVSWNHHHQNWERANCDEGGAIHRKLSVIVTDPIGGGPEFCTLTEARELAGVPTPQVLSAASTLGRLGGRSRSERKREAARANGLRGGRPKRNT